MRRIDYLNDPHAPQITRIVPSASTIVTNNEGKILLQQRRDTGYWALPGGAMEIGETIEDTARRETKEETGFDVELEYLVGVYTNPHHVVAFSPEDVRQQFSLCFAAHIVGENLKVSHESTEVGFFSREEIAHLHIHPSIHPFPSSAFS